MSVGGSPAGWVLGCFPTMPAVPPPAEPTDETLLRQMAAGDEGALLELHGRYARLLHALGYRMLRQRDDVETCVQDAFMNAWRHAARFDPSRASAKTWLVSIAHHRFLQQLRDRPAAGLELEEWDAPTPAADPTDRVLAARAVGALEAGARELVELAYFHGYSHSELAARTGLPLGTVKSRLRAAVDRMRAALGTPQGTPKGGEP